MLPYRCDAPLYHLPFGTVSLIIANVVVFVGLITGHLFPFDGWMLEYGTGLHPKQWFLSIFAHTDFTHLISNMFFLWIFGLVTEGKLGWYRFLPCYFLIGVGQSAIEQFMFSGSAYAGGFSLGASSAIFGLMAMACVWAPMSEVSIFFFLFFRVYTFEISIGILSALYVGLNLTVCLITGGADGSSLLHLMGVVAGGALGVLLLKRGIVDCEHWDLFSVLSGAYGPDAKKRENQPLTEDETAQRDQSQAIDADKMFHACLASNQSMKALAVRLKMIDLGNPLDLNRKDLLALIVGLHKQKEWQESVPIMVELLERFPDGSEPVRLKLAQICLVELERPAKALDLLEEITARKLTEQQQKMFRKLRAVAKHQIDQGVLEVDDGAW